MKKRYNVSLERRIAEAARERGKELGLSFSTFIQIALLAAMQADDSAGVQKCGKT